MVPVTGRVEEIVVAQVMEGTEVVAEVVVGVIAEEVVATTIEEEAAVEVITLKIVVVSHLLPKVATRESEFKLKVVL